MRGGYRVLSAQTRPRTERKKGVTGVLRSRGGSPEKPGRGQASGSTPALPLGTWGLQIRGAGARPSPVSGGQGPRPAPSLLPWPQFPQCLETREVAPQDQLPLGPWGGHLSVDCLGWGGSLASLPGGPTLGLGRRMSWAEMGALGEPEFPGLPDLLHLEGSGRLSSSGVFLSLCL